MDPASNNALKAYDDALMNMVAISIEARVCQRALEQCPRFIKAFESASSDCGVVLEDILDQSEGPARAIFTLLRGALHKEIMLFLDIKHIEARLCIIASAKEPDFIIFLPTFYLPSEKPGTKDVNKEQVSVAPFRPEWMLHPVPAFPGELTLFVRPIVQLGAALENMIAYAKQEAQWRNEYTGASFKDAPQPKRLKPSKLCPSQDGHTLSMRQVEGLYDAFANHSLRFQVELVGVSPMLADMKLIDPSRKVEIFVEMKEKFCNLITTGHSQVLGFMQVRDGTRLTFSWKSQWDYIYSTVANMPSTAILLPRDEIPLTWFNFWPKKSGFVLELEADFQQYSVDTHSDETMVQDIEKILIRMEKKSGSMRAKRPIPVEVSEEEYSQRTTVHRQGGEHWEERWSTSSFLRGLGSAEHGELRDLTYGQFASEVLIEICRASGKGLVCDFGIWNPICRYGIARYTWEHEDKRYYDLHKEPPKRVWNLHKETLVVPLEFTQMTWTGREAPTHTWHSQDQCYNIHQRSAWPRLLVLDLYSSKCMRLSHGRLVVPSELVRRGNFRSRCGILVDDAGVTDQYYVEQDHLIDTLTAPLQGNRHFTVGSSEGEFHAADYCLTVEQIHQEGVGGVMKFQDHKNSQYKV